jgi:hypothetical protein
MFETLLILMYVYEIIYIHTFQSILIGYILLLILLYFIYIIIKFIYIYYQ